MRSVIVVLAASGIGGLVDAAQGRLLPVRYGARAWSRATAASVGAAAFAVPASCIDAPPVAWTLFALVALVVATSALTDMRVHRIPNSVLLAGVVGALAAVGLAVLAGQAALAARGLVALTVGALSFAAFAAVRGVTARSLGMGDVKLLAFVAGVLAWFGLGTVVVAILVAAAAAAVYKARLRRGTAVPLAPFLLFGAVSAPLVVQLLATA